MSDTTPQLAPPKDNAFLIIAMILAAMFGGVLLLLMFVPIPQENKDLLNILLGVLGGSFTTMVAWYYGSSASSRQKTSFIAASAPVQPEVKE